MHEEFVQFERNEVWKIVPRLNSTNIVGTKWIYKNKFDENENDTINKARLMVQGYT